MKGLRWAGVALALLGFLSTFLIEASFEARTTRVQPVRRQEGRWVTVGKPIDWVLVPKAAIVEPARDGNAALVDIERAKEPVLTADSFRRLAWLTRIGCLMALVWGAVILGLLDRYQRRVTEE